MAKTATKRRKKVKKMSLMALRISTRLLTIQLLQSQIEMAILFHGLLRAAVGFVDHAKVLLLQHRLHLKKQVKQQKNLVCKIWKFL